MKVVGQIAKEGDIPREHFAKLTTGSVQRNSDKRLIANPSQAERFAKIKALVEAARQTGEILGNKRMKMEGEL